MVDPDDPNSPVDRESLYQTYGLRPIAVSLFSPDSYYFHLVLETLAQTDVLYPGGDMSEAEIRNEIESALKRAAPGFLKTVGLWTPPAEPQPDGFGGMTQPISSWNSVREQLSQSYNVRGVDLSTGRVPGEIDVLVLLAPQQMSDKERFAVDQYLMRGGAVVVAAGQYVLAPQQFATGLNMAVVEQGLTEMLNSYGVQVEEALVLDTQNQPFPVQVQRNIGGMSVMEIQQVDYPYFVDVRRDNMAGDSPVSANLPAVTLQWASPIQLDPEKTEELEVTTLLSSSNESWLRSSTDVQPDLQQHPGLGFPIAGEQKARPLAVSLRGSLESFFKDRASPFAESEDAQDETIATDEDAATQGEEDAPVVGTIEESPASSRLSVIGSAEFVDDVVLDLSASLSADRYLLNLQFLQNLVDWSVEDEDLLAIRARGTYTRLLKPLEESEQSFWELLNYGVALVAVIAIGVVWNVRQRSEAPMLLSEHNPGGEL
jgi:ABC-2 type transport system permease protein